MLLLCMLRTQEKILENFSLEDLPKVATQLIEFARDIKLWLFNAEMGAGKTTLINQICKELRVEEPTSSPTFSIVNEYLTLDNKTVYHFDCYRLNSAEEAFHLGFEDYIYSGNYCFIEWPDKVDELLPNTGYLNIEINAELNGLRTLKMVRYE